MRDDGHDRRIVAHQGQMMMPVHEASGHATFAFPAVYALRGGSMFGVLGNSKRRPGWL